ncbi:MAG: pyruvate kinase [Pseudomonadota bacterium]|nr:pyruvate kinase [Pseudomonadota bacterium]
MKIKITQPDTATHWRRTKIIATLGPASCDEHMIRQLVSAGVDVFRFNMSHGSHDLHRINFQRVRTISRQLDRHVAILMDLCGPKIRVGKFRNGEISLLEGESVRVSCRAVIGESGVIPSQYPALHKDVRPGQRILLDDGKLELHVEAVKDKDIFCRVIYGGVLSDNKGMNLPDTSVTASSFTAKDKNDAKLAAELDADFVAMSFVRRDRDVKTVQQFFRKLGKDIPIIAKIEKPEAIHHIDSILKSAYGIMIARGDLGIELPAQQVPLIQRDLISRARLMSRPVIVATQMLESMIHNARPTRAEVGDVAGAAFASADAVMLSAETASGKYPLKSVQIMDSVLREIESYQWNCGKFIEPLWMAGETLSSVRKAVSHAATSLARELKLQGIVVPTRTGTTAVILAADRPVAPLLGVCTDEFICRRLALHWGVLPFRIEKRVTHDWKKLCKDISSRCQLKRTGNTVLLVSGFNDDPALNEPVMKIMRL